MSLEKDYQQFMSSDNDYKIFDVMKHFGERKEFDYPTEVYEAAAEKLMNHPLANIIKKASKGDHDTATKMVYDLDMTGDVPMLKEGVQKSWENYQELATLMLK